MNIRVIRAFWLLAFLFCLNIIHADEPTQSIPIHANKVIEVKLLDRLKQATVPRFKIKDVPLKAAILHLKEQMKRIDPTGKAFNVLYKCKKESQLRSITLDIRDAPVSELIYFLCMKSHLNYRVEKYAVIVWDIKKGEKMNKY